MGVVVGEEGVDGAGAQLAVGVGDGLEVVDKGDAGAVDGLLRRLLVADEARRRGDEAARLPLVVGRLRAEDDGGALGSEELGRLADVEDESVDLLARLVRGAHFGARPGAVGAEVVVALGRASVVVAKLNHHNVSRLDHVGHLLEAALVPVRARRASANGLVDRRGRQVLSDVLAPAVGGSVVGALVGHGAVAAEVDSGSRPGSQLNGVGGHLHGAKGQHGQRRDGKLHGCQG